MKVRLAIQHQKANVNSVVLHSDAVIGRSTECNLRLASGKISRKHCKLLINDERVAVLDLGSSNGTYLNREQLEPNVETIVSPGDQLKVGSVSFQVDFSDPAAETKIRKEPSESEFKAASIPPVDDASNHITPAVGNRVIPDSTVDGPATDSDEVDLDEISDEELEALLTDEGFEPEAEQFAVELEDETEPDPGDMVDTINFSNDELQEPALEEFDQKDHDASSPGS